MPNEQYARYSPDLTVYVERTRSGPCFICRMIARDPDFKHHVIYEDQTIIAFLSKGQTQLGYTLVAPKEHREQVSGDFSVEEYVELQKVLYRVAGSIQQELGAVRVYLMSLGSNEGNAHVHWHVVPLPPDVPYKDQQFAAVMAESAGYLDVPDEDMESLAMRIRERMI